MNAKSNNFSIKEIFDKNAGKLVLFANGYLNDSNLAEDVVQEAFVVLWERLDKFENEKAIASFLYVTVKNKCINQLKRKKKIAAEIPEQFEEDFFYENYIKSEYAAIIHKTIALLPTKQKEVFIRSYIYEQPRQEIADQLGMTINTVQTHLRRAKSFLKNYLMDKLFPLIILWSYILILG